VTGRRRTTGSTRTGPLSAAAEGRAAAEVTEAVDEAAEARAEEAAGATGSRGMTATATTTTIGTTSARNSAGPYARKAAGDGA
tara:strand:+ start:522 stop:770 length:249 start_codon:yes stop_codon:yes gene_type:complete